MTLSETLKKYWYVPFAIFGILLLCYFIVLFVMISNEPSYRLYLFELNDNSRIQPTGYYTENYTIGYKSQVFTLTEEDFKVFPKLAPIIRDKNQKPGFVDNEGSIVYTVAYREDEHSAFTSRFGLFGCLEYKGKYYNFNFINVD